jgi:antitoxin component of MazEF toxin-antitoxin module
MAKKIDEANVRKLTDRGRNSIGITLPMEIVKKIGWREGRKVVVKIERGKIVISDWKK